MPDSTFQTLYKSLNKAQKQAVDAIEGPVMVIAGPGTGKTHILSLRIANILLKTDTPANGILAITFTTSGVKAIRERLKSIIGQRAFDVRIHTFHSFASSIIAEYPDHFLHMSDVKQMTDVEQEMLIREILLDPKFRDLRPPARPDVYLGGIVRGIDEAKRDALTPEMVAQYAKDEIERIKKDETYLSTRGPSKGKLKAEALDLIEKCQKTIFFSEVYKEYEKRKNEARQNDYNDLIIELLQALRNDELLLRMLQERYLYIHIDEHQDTNDAQNLIIKLIAEFFNTPNIFIVGDEKQAIYRFQGASVENFFLLKKKWPAMQEIALDKNYRSHQQILDASFSMIENNYEGDEHGNLRIKLEAGGEEKPKPLEVVTAENTTAMESYLVDEVRKIQEGSVAIITRTNKDLDRIIRLLESHGITVSSERSVDIFTHPVGRLFFNLVEYLVDKSRLDLLGLTVAGGMWNLSFEECVTLSRELRSGNTKNLEKKIPALNAIAKRMLGDGPISFLIHAAKESGFEGIVAQDPSYVYVWRGIITLCESIVRDSHSSDPLDLLQKLVAYKTSAESRLIKVSVGAPDAQVQAMTAHGSKGLEFDYVFIPYATEESWVGKNRGASFILPKKSVEYHNIEDVRRFFYVAITRARKHAVVLSALEEVDGKELTPLRFISELDPKCISHITLPRRGSEEIYHGGTHARDSSEAFLNLAKKVIHEDGLSVTALNHYIACPNEFLYLSVLRLPQAPSVASEKGNAMHEAISKVWKLEERSAATIEKCLKEGIVTYFENSFLSAAEKKIAESELLEALPEVVVALTPHFTSPQKSSLIFTETWTEGEHIIPIHGKLDAVVDDGSKAQVFDYKTKQGMSENAIRGLTKTDTGNEFRQLIFYKLLLENDIRFKNRTIVPALVFISPDEKGRCPIVTLPVEKKDIDEVKKLIESLVKDVESGEIMTRKCNDPKCEWCGLRSIAV
jgi:DNA helicase-2/ATP-dependent DNA helicase PcrA